jgi:hypothetical protein
MPPPPATRSAVLLILFNRPDTTAQVFARIRDARPPRLYLAADGPRLSRPQDTQDCRAAREAAGPVDWPCEVRTFFRDQNVGCMEAVSDAVGWFFDNETEGIILEDDCLPTPDFFRFCDAMLEHYRDDRRIRHISGSNLQHGRARGDASYYFSSLTHIWGWASWRRAWRDYDRTLAQYTTQELARAFETTFNNPFVAGCWSFIARIIQLGDMKTWDYQLAITNVLQRGLSIIPNVNLISNIGFDDRGTHTQASYHSHANLPTGRLGKITHPHTFLPDRVADDYTLAKEFESQKEEWENQKLALERRLKKERNPRIRLKRWFKAQFRRLFFLRAEPTA